MGYFEEWKKEISSLRVSSKEKQRMLISRETMEGLKITGIPCL